MEHVDNEKYGKDVGKLALLERKDPGCRRLIVSSKGFSAPVRERAEQTGIRTFTYDELFAQFQQFSAYTNYWIGDSRTARELSSFVSLYEKPAFNDRHGHQDARQFLTSWCSRCADLAGTPLAEISVES